MLCGVQRPRPLRPRPRRRPRLSSSSTVVGVDGRVTDGVLTDGTLDPGIDGVLTEGIEGALTDGTELDGNELEGAELEGVEFDGLDETLSSEPRPRLASAGEVPSKEMVAIAVADMTRTDLVRSERFIVLLLSDRPGWSLPM
jgi:hypothetical protein